MKKHHIILFAVISLFLYQCKKDDDPSRKWDSEVTDIDGNVYQAVVIGNHNWCTENLKVTKYNDGTVITIEPDKDIWQSNYKEGKTIPLMCWYDNEETNKDIYGGLYNWYAVGTGKLCPQGWHVATENDWKDLVLSVGQGFGTKLRSRSGWGTNSYANGTDDFGFNALPGGYRDNWGASWSTDQGYEDKQFLGWWWSSTPLPTDNSAFRIWLKYHHDEGELGYSEKAYGMACRCVQD